MYSENYHHPFHEHDPAACSALTYSIHPALNFGLCCKGSKWLSLRATTPDSHASITSPYLLSPHMFAFPSHYLQVKALLVLQGLKVAVIEGHDIGGTCVNRGCVPSKALLAASGRVRDLKNAMHLQSLGIQVCSNLVSRTYVGKCHVPPVSGEAGMQQRLVCSVHMHILCLQPDFAVPACASVSRLQVLRPTGLVALLLLRRICHLSQWQLQKVCKSVLGWTPLLGILNCITALHLAHLNAGQLLVSSAQYWDAWLIDL